ncbi:hypothetical protein E1B28_002487 [Marasmius oreades]|uniref:F-box domain-containing protein n=1 Tax=Marasmius oreades TaxID=181124 RepID=A0A9P7UN52_9AGAR|nr:uncharacterized protein E1B28_002487 [Marasmius oreades]KAG7086536.1 hypothetical protein E1B28_002487 [Marasmius oreades]
MHTPSMIDATGPSTKRSSLMLGVLRKGFNRTSFTPSCQVGLPRDLLQQIIEELDEESVRQCALAARCFLVPARRRLFTTISLCEEEYPKNFFTGRWHRVRVGMQRHLPSLVGPSRTRRFAELLEATPDLEECTQELIIEGLKLVDGRRSWYNEKDAPLHRILPRLPNLTKISLVFHHNFPLQFHSLPTSSSEALIRAVQSPKLRKIVLENVRFSDVDDLIRFLKHCSSGGGLTELSVTSFYYSRPTEEEERAQVPVSTWAPGVPNVLASLQLNGHSIDVEKILGWMRSHDSYVHLDELESLEVVSPMSPECLTHITEIIHSARVPSQLRHLGLTSSTESLRSLSISCPLAQTFLPSKNNLRTIDFYPISRNYDHLFTLPAESVDWWCGFLKTFELPNLMEFRVSRRGTHAHYMICSGLGLFGDPVENTTQWQKLELQLTKSAPKATLYIDIRSRGYLRASKWKRLYFPDDSSRAGYTNFEVFFPLAHQGRIPLVIDLKVNTKAINRRQRLRENSQLPKAFIKHRGHFMYTPETRWDVLEDFMWSDWHENVNASRTEFEYVFLLLF